MDELTSLSLRRMRQFLVVAETLHMARAAEKIGIAQPALSQQIRGLEEGLGVKLFHRRKRGIDLTAAGEAYRVSATKLLEMHREAAERARLFARGELGRLAIGYVASAFFSKELPSLLRDIRTAAPGLTLELREAPISRLCEDIEAGLVDVALLRAPVSLQPGWDHLALAPQSLLVALPSDHLLAKREQLTISDLVDQPMVSYSDPADVGIMRVVRKIAARTGVTLDIQWDVSTMTGILGLVASGFGFGIVPAGIVQLRPRNVEFVPLAEVDAVAELWYVWRSTAISPALRQLLDRVRMIKAL